jgi:type IV secretion system protein VirB1
MDTATFFALALACAPQVHPHTAQALVRVESAFNPWAIGVVGGALMRQPRHRDEAIATAQALQAAGWNFSVGLGQINLRNFERLGLTLHSAFEPCANLGAMQTVLGECYGRASLPTSTNPQPALHRALSCYYSGNFTTGLRDGYVRKVIAAAAMPMPMPMPMPIQTPAAGLSAVSIPVVTISQKEPS